MSARVSNMWVFSWLMMWLATTCVGPLAGCGFQLPCPQAIGKPVSVVLTFDDGPLPADVPADVRAAAGDTLLDPLWQILQVLNRRGVRAVFYIAAPGNEPDARALSSVWAQGVAGIHSAGHVPGYHAFRHDPAVWADPSRCPVQAMEAMRVDLDQLEDYASLALAPLGLARTDVFQPVFRQPYGGVVFDSYEACRVANERGWRCHAYVIDSLDWLVNVDTSADLRESVLSCAQADTIAIVAEQLQRRAAETDCESIVDILMHVNHQTADHLDEWIDTLTTAFAEQGRTAIFEVPAAYLDADMPSFDVSLLGYLLCDH